MKLAHVTGTWEIPPEGLPALMQTLKKALDAKTRKSIRKANFTLTKQSVRESVTPDKLIISTVGSLEELDRITQKIVVRLRDWYALYDPEVENAYSDHQEFVSVIMESRERVKDTMGGKFSEEDLTTLITEAQAALTLYAQQDYLMEYLEKLMEEHTPNIKAVAGVLLGAKVLSLAGSLKRLSRMPSGTIQLLGAETALFRHLKTKARPPKHGIIFNHPLLQKAQKRGKAARAIADALAIAARIDFFKGEFYGDKLLAKVEAVK